MIKTRLLISSMALGLCVGAHAQPPAQPPPPRVVSPEIAADSKVTFRIRAAEAHAVALTSGGDLPQIPFQQTLPLTKASDGVWSLTIGPVAPGAYRYAFVVDGVTTVDPAQPRVSQSNDNTWSLFHVPGAKFMDTLDVPHGTVADVRYFSAELGKWRRMHVYTPPDYGLAQKRYPVLYLLHGAFDSDDSWSSVGRAADILDNLIAQGKAAPMIVAMPAGHQGPFTLGGGAGSLNLDGFVREFDRDIRPYIEKHYTTRSGPKSTAIAGLSMGGAQTLEIAVRHLKDFGYVGVFSSGVLGGNGADVSRRVGRAARRTARRQERAHIACARLVRDRQGRLSVADDERDGRDAREARLTPGLPRQRRRPCLEQLARLPLRVRAAALQVTAVECRRRAVCWLAS